MISYAQNFEDVMLWRALKHVEKGNYIDIGAQDPLIDSVSLAFHELGWRGIHIEPTPHYADLLRQQRPGDTVIQAAVGKGPAVLQFFEIPDTGISTADPAIAQQHRERGFVVQETTVPCIALSAIFDTCSESDIHWLKIDVEGFEKQVLTSWGKSRARPWIVVVESTLPMTQIETHETWESILTGYGYSPIYFDGLNRYYISNSHPELQSAFKTPPNVFDGFNLNGTASNPIHHLIADRHKQQIGEIEAKNKEMELSFKKEIGHLNQSLMELNQAHAERIHQLNHALQQAQVDSEAREQIHANNIATLTVELSNLLRAQVQREQEFNTQLHAIHQQTEAEKTDLSQRHHHSQLQYIQQQQAAELVQQKLNRELLAQQEVSLLALAEISILEQQLADLQLWEKQLHTSLAQQAKHAGTLAQHLMDIQSTWLWRLFTLFRPTRWSHITTANKIDLINFSNIPSTQGNNTVNNYHQNETAHHCIEEDPAFEPNITAPQPTREFSDMLPPQHIYELFIFDEREFINAAYRTLIGREPDPNGMNYYLGRLRMGYGKASVIVQLANSTEAVPQNKIKGLSKLVKEEQQATHWFWGMFYTKQRKMNLLRQHNENLTQINSSLARLETATHLITSGTNTLLQRIQDILAEPSEPEGFKRLSPRARDIYLKLKSIHLSPAKKGD